VLTHSGNDIKVYENNSEFVEEIPGFSYNAAPETYVHHFRAQQDFKLKPIRRLIQAAFVLHIAGIFVMAMITAFQIPLRNIFLFSHNTMFIMPSAIFIGTIAVILACHGVLTLCFMRIMASGEDCTRPLNAAAVAAVVFVVILRPVVDHISQHFNVRFMIWGEGAEQIAETITTMNMLYYGQAVRNVSLLVLLIGASMALYFCYAQRHGSQLCQQ